MKKISRKILILCLLLFSTSASFAQGIQFAQGLNWEQVLATAKSEHKYIFVDCYATWCGPCKAMEQNVYTLPEVADVYNKDFISIKVQMDKTAKDDAAVKSWYDVAHMLETSYHVNAYPTFMFFDENGGPVHKSIGGLDATAFIKLAADAQNPAKQYYSILKNFKPNTLDTADEHGLIYSSLRSGSDLSGKLAADYLSRIPEKQLNNSANGAMMVDFQSNPDVLDIALDYIQKHGIANNLQFLEALAKQPKAAAVAKNYIASLKENQLYDKPMIGFLSVFSKTPDDRTGFELFYHNSEKVNKIMNQHGYAEGEARRMIDNALVQPNIKLAKQTGITPNFDSLKTLIAYKYSPEYADGVVIGAKMGWYKYLLNTKGGEKYWPDYITARIAQVNRFRFDTVAAYGTGINNIAWDIFIHGQQKDQLLTAADWMKTLIAGDAKNSTLLDTYACLLYKAGKKKDALNWENKALVCVRSANNKNEISYTESTISKMQKDEHIWEEKEYTN